MLSSLEMSCKTENLSASQSGAISQVVSHAAWAQTGAVCLLSLSPPSSPLSWSSSLPQAFFDGKLKMRGNIMLSQKLDILLKDHAKLWGALWPLHPTPRPAVPRLSRGSGAQANPSYHRMESLNAMRFLRIKSHGHRAWFSRACLRPSERVFIYINEWVKRCVTAVVITTTSLQNRVDLSEFVFSVQSDLSERKLHQPWPQPLIAMASVFGTLTFLSLINVAP